MYNLFPWLLNFVRIHTLTMGDDTYEITDMEISKVRAKEKDHIFEVVETPEMDISDCSCGKKGARVKVYLVKCRDTAYAELVTELKKQAEMRDLPIADMSLNI